MKKITLFILMAIASVFFVACGTPATNAPANSTNTNTNTNTAKPTAAAPTKDALFAMDKQANEAALKGDGKFFEGFLSDKFVSYDMGNRMVKADIVKMFNSMKCETKSWSLDDAQMAMIDADTAVVSYKGIFDGSCTDPAGKSMKMPSPMRGASIYVRSGDKWLGAWHGETLIVDPKNPLKAVPPAPPAKKEVAKKDDKSAANSNANAAPATAKQVADANTDALVKIHTSGWEAFKAKDAKKFDEIMTANMANVDPLGGWTSGKANVIKLWTETMKCEGITKVSVSDGFASALSPTVELLTLKGTADGKCDGQPNGPLYQSAVYVKEGDAWKLAFMFESPAM